MTLPAGSANLLAQFPPASAAGQSQARRRPIASPDPHQRIAWHPLLVLTLKPLLPETDELRSEFPITQEPQRIDIVIIRHDPTSAPPLALLPSIMQHLGEHTLLEFKSPTDRLEPDDLQLLLS